MFQVLKIKRNLVVGSVVAITIMVGACGHATMRHEVAEKPSNDRAVVCMNDGELQQDDAVVIYTVKCSSLFNNDTTSECTATKIAEGTVSKLVNEHYSEVMITDGGSFSEGARVVRKSEFKEKYKAYLKRIK